MVTPMLGHRGVRLAITYPEIYAMQTQAVLEAEAECIKEGVNAVVEIMYLASVAGCCRTDRNRSRSHFQIVLAERGRGSRAWERECLRSQANAGTRAGRGGFTMRPRHSDAKLGTWHSKIGKIDRQQYRCLRAQASVQCKVLHPPLLHEFGGLSRNIQSL